LAIVIQTIRIKYQAVTQMRRKALRFRHYEGSKENPKILVPPDNPAGYVRDPLHSPQRIALGKNVGDWKAPPVSTTPHILRSRYYVSGYVPHLRRPI
jgi:hypothetical protein